MTVCARMRAFSARRYRVVSLSKPDDSRSGPAGTAASGTSGEHDRALTGAVHDLHREVDRSDTGRRFQGERAVGGEVQPGRHAGAARFGHDVEAVWRRSARGRQPLDDPAAARDVGEARRAEPDVRVDEVGLRGGDREGDAGRTRLGALAVDDAVEQRTAEQARAEPAQELAGAPLRRGRRSDRSAPAAAPVPGAAGWRGRDRGPRRRSSAWPWAAADARGRAQQRPRQGRHREGVVRRRGDVHHVCRAGRRAVDRERRAGSGGEQKRGGTLARARLRQQTRELPFQRAGERGLRRRRARRRSR